MKKINDTTSYRARNNIENRNNDRMRNMESLIMSMFSFEYLQLVIILSLRFLKMPYTSDQS